MFIFLLIKCYHESFALFGIKVVIESGWFLIHSFSKANFWWSDD